MGSNALGESDSLRIRAFFGLPLPEDQRPVLDRYLAESARLAPQFRWTPAANLHLTMRFLGHLDAPVAESIADRLEEQALRGFDLQLGQVGTFKRGRLARVVWIGFRSGAEAAAALAAVVEAESVRVGLEAEARKFNAHITLARARARDGAVLPELPAVPELPAWHAGELILYRSHLGRTGSVYEPIRRLRLR